MLRPGLTAVLALLGAAALGCGNGLPERDRAPTPAATVTAAKAQPGDMAPDYLSADRYPALLIEVAAPPSVWPNSESLDVMKARFNARLGKPGGVNYIIEEIPEQAKGKRWQVGDLLALENQHRRSHTGDALHRDQAVIWVVYLSGESEFDEGTTRALGVSYDASSIAVFRDNITRTTATPAQQTVEAMVLVHEGGHLFGLTNSGTPMYHPHEDPANPRHDSNPDCIMFHKIDTSDVGKLVANPAIDFDYQCRLDMMAAGGPELTGLPPLDAPPSVLVKPTTPPGTLAAAAATATTPRRGPIPITAEERPK